MVLKVHNISQLCRAPQILALTACVRMQYLYWKCRDKIGFLSLCGHDQHWRVAVVLSTLLSGPQTQMYPDKASIFGMMGNNETKSKKYYQQKELYHKSKASQMN